MTDCAAWPSLPRPETAAMAAVLFDMDGLLLDTERLCLAVWLDAALQIGAPIVRTVPLACIGLSEKATRAKVLELCGPDYPYDAVHARFRELFAERVTRDGIAHRPGLLALLDLLAGRGLPLAVATSTRRSSAERSLERAGIRSRFKALACGDEVRRGKPAPDVFLLAAERLGAAPGACVGFEDSAAGLRSLAAAGIRSVFVKDLVDPPAEVMRTVWRQYPDLAAAAEMFG